MPSIAAPLLLAVYVALEPFETVVDTPGPEFKAQSNSNGLPRESLLKRTFVMVKDTVIQIEGITVDLPRGKDLRDVGQAMKVLKQRPEAIAVRDRIKLEAGQEIPAALGQALAAGGYKVREAQPEPGPEIGFKVPDDGQNNSSPQDPPAAPKAETAAEKKARLKAEADAAAAEKEGQA